MVTGLADVNPAMIRMVERGGGRGKPARYVADPAAILVHASRAVGLEDAARQRDKEERAAWVADREATRWKLRAIGRDVLVEMPPAGDADWLDSHDAERAADSLYVAAAEPADMPWAEDVDDTAEYQEQRRGVI